MATPSFGPGMRVMVLDHGVKKQGVVQSLSRLADGTVVATVRLEGGKTVAVA
ncbi:hypothetical protein AURDEDRAFT_166789 [Auricularia subglabra TFB-10046 SS5]|nr:hypothetical protein AURDEDRAFT_166789 [Auricularia subglabra TFB-10046 SS5]